MFFILNFDTYNKTYKLVKSRAQIFDNKIAFSEINLQKKYLFDNLLTLYFVL